MPRFGNTSARETAKAENGTLYEVDGEGTALYSVQLASSSQGSKVCVMTGFFMVV